MFSIEEVANTFHRHVLQLLGGVDEGQHVFDAASSDSLSNTNTEDDEKAAVTPISLKTVIIGLVVVAPFYGAVMGSYGWAVGLRGFVEQLPQVFFSAVKMPLLILMTLAICIPSFFVFNSVAGLRSEFLIAVKAIISSLASFAIVLFSLAPFTGLFYYSMFLVSGAYQAAVLVNALMFCVAALSSQFVLLKSYRQLIASNKRHVVMLVTWVIVFAFVGIQLGWTLRPFIGDPNQEITFFRQEPMSNAYIQLIRIIQTTVEEMFF